MRVRKAASGKSVMLLLCSVSVDSWYAYCMAGDGIEVSMLLSRRSVVNSYCVLNVVGESIVIML